MHSKQCKQCKNQFPVYDEDLKFYAKMDMPEPTLCSDCRLQTILANRNDISLYQRKCDLCKKDIISIYSNDKPYTVYCNSCWWGDNWDPSKYAKEFDFTRPFFEQFQELQEEVPRIALFNKNTENAEYNNDISGAKNCYVSSRVYFGCENVYYSLWVFNSTDVGYSAKVYDSQIVFKSFDCRKSYNILYSQYIENSRDCYYSRDLKNCQNCLLCVNMRDRQYYYKNKKVTPEEFEEKRKLHFKDRDAIAKALEELHTIRQGMPNIASVIQSSESSTGNDLRDCKNCISCFDLRSSENCRYAMAGAQNRDSMDTYSFQAGELVYYSTDVFKITTGIGNRFVWEGHDICYSDLCFGTHDIFGCIGLRNKDHNIFNKQYSETEYLALEKQIIIHMKAHGEWGEFFPIQNSLFGYNETPAQDFFPLIKDKALANGYKWLAKDIGTKGKESQKGENIPGSIEKTSNAVTNEIFSCVQCNRNFKIVVPVLKYHRKLRMPLPNTCSQCLKDELLQEWPKPKLHDRACAKCKSPIKTSYAPERPEIVYCEKCYQESLN